MFLSTFLVNFPLKCIGHKLMRGSRLGAAIGDIEFVIPKHVLDIVYGQTLCWLGMFYSPLLPAVTCVKLCKKITYIWGCNGRDICLPILCYVGVKFCQGCFDLLAWDWYNCFIITSILHSCCCYCFRSSGVLHQVLRLQSEQQSVLPAVQNLPLQRTLHFHPSGVLHRHHHPCWLLHRRDQAFGGLWTIQRAWHHLERDAGSDRRWVTRAWGDPVVFLFEYSVVKSNINWIKTVWQILVISLNV